MRWQDLPIIAFDTETTGLNPEDGDRVIEFAAIAFKLAPDGSVASARSHVMLFNPERPIPREATEVSGIKDEDVASAPKFEERAQEVLKLLSGAVTVAHNYPFDQRMLTAEFARLGLRWPSPPAEIDTVDLSRRFFPDAKSHKLGELAQRLEIPLENAHRADADAEACGRCFLSMARKHGAPGELPGLVDWADAIGDPPETGHLGRDLHRTIVFLDGPKKGEPVDAHPDLLTWMTFARERGPDGWGLRYPESVRKWAERWLRVRASGRAQQGMKGFGAADWGIDPPLGAGGTVGAGA